MSDYFYICPECEQQDVEDCEALLGASDDDIFEYQEWVDNMYDSATPGKCVFCERPQPCP